MTFTLIKSALKGIEIPQVIFDSLKTVRNDELKIILYILKNNLLSPIDIASNLNLSLASVNSAMLFWADMGLLHCNVEEDKPKKKRKEISSLEISRLIGSSPEIGLLSKHIQTIFGFTLNEKYINRFIALYIEENIPVDVILQISSYSISKSQDNPAYIIKVIRSWFTKLGITSGSMVDEYIKLWEKRNERYKSVCKIFSLDLEKLKTQEKTIIDRWFEQFNFSLLMVEESFIRAGHQGNILYCNGILKAWSQKGYKTPLDLSGEISNISQSVKNIDIGDDFLLKSTKKIPIFKDAQKRDGQ